MTAVASERLSLARFAPRPTELAWCYGALLVTLVLQLPILLRRAINWDEFYHYSLVERLAHGTLTEPLQTLFTRAFFWVTNLPGTGVDHVIVIRLFMFACELVTIASMIAMATRFTDRTTGVLCALGYVSASFVFKHGTSFRFDPPAAALLMSAACLLLRSELRWRALLAIALLAGVATVLTIKTVLYAPVFAGIAWLRWDERGRRRADIGRLAALAGLTVAAALLIYLLHASTLGSDADSRARGVVDHAAASMFTFGNHMYAFHALVGAVTSPLTALAVLCAPVAIWFMPSPASQRIALAGMWAPLTTLLFYQNTAPYYYVYMLAPVAVSTAPVLALARKRYHAAAIAVVFAACAAAVLYMEPANPIDKQRQIQRVADRIFPGDTAYFDSFAMLGTHPKANAFMTPWGTELYRQGALPSMIEAMQRQVVPLVVQDDWMFDEALETNGPVDAFRADDLAALRQTYVPFWGPLWLAGKNLPAHTGPAEWIVRVPGPYTVRDGRVAIDGHTWLPDQVVTLDRGPHRLATGDNDARLLWGQNLRAPAEPAPAPPLTMPF